MRYVVALICLLSLVAFLMLATAAPRDSGSDPTSIAPPVKGGVEEVSVEILPLNYSGVPTIEYEEPFQVQLNNRGTEPLRLWNTNSPQGYYQLFFQFTDPNSRNVSIGHRRLITDDKYWDALAAGRGGEGIIEIPAGQSASVPVDLSDFAWGEQEWVGLPSPNAPHSWSLSVELTCDPSPQSGAQRVWSGRVRSQPVRVQFVALRLQTPHRYLWNGFPEGALRLLQSDSKWIEARDEDRCTPLHHASRFGHADVVKWLVEQNANVDAVAYNGFTPLYFADRPEIVRLLLEGKPDLTKRTWGKNALQEAVCNQFEARGDADRQRWGEIADLYRQAGATDDLMVAIYEDDLLLVKDILTKEPQLADAFQSESPLRLAASLGREEICRYLLDHYDVDVDDFKRGTGYPIIKEALAFPSTVRLLIERGADLETRITWRGGRTGYWVIGDDATALHYAAEDGVPETVTLLIDGGVDIFATAHDLFDPTSPMSPTSEQTALEVAAIFGKAANAAAIIDHPKFSEADEAVRNKLLNKCLMLAARGRFRREQGDQARLIETILKHGADVHQQGASAVQLAAQGIHPSQPDENTNIREAIGILKAHGAQVDLFSAVAIGDETAVAERLKQDPQSASARGPNGYPALHFAVRMDYGNIVEMLLAAGVDIEIRNQSHHLGWNGETPLHCAAFWNRLDIVKTLIAACAEVNARAPRDVTPLHEAARLGNIQMVRLLLEHGAELNAKDVEGKTAEEWAEDPIQYRQVVAEYLKSRANPAGAAPHQPRGK